VRCVLRSNFYFLCLFGFDGSVRHPHSARLGPNQLETYVLLSSFSPLSTRNQSGTRIRDSCVSQSPTRRCRSERQIPQSRSSVKFRALSKDVFLINNSRRPCAHRTWEALLGANLGVYAPLRHDSSTYLAAFIVGSCAVLAACLNQA
jgi:hypothetical protein